MVRSVVAAAAVVIAIAIACVGCGGRCAELEASRVAFFAARAPAAPADGAPELAVAVPYALIDHALAIELAASPRIALPVPGELGALVPGIAQLELVVTGIAMRPAAADRIGLRLAIAIVDGDTQVVTLTADLEAMPVLAHKGGQLVVAIAPGEVGGVHPVLGPGATAALADAIIRRLHLDPMAALLARGPLQRGAAKLTEWLAGHTLDSLLGPALARVRDTATVRIAVGGAAGTVPVTEIQLRSTSTGVVLTAHFELPIATGLSVLPAIGDPDIVRVRVPGATLAAFANWAIASGVVPARYEGGKPSPTGSLTPGLAWAPGPRPLKLHLWRRVSPCMHAEVGTTPSLAIGADGKLHIELRDPVIEHLTGNFLIHARMWFYAFALDGALASHVELAVAHQRIALATVAAAADDDGVALDLRVTEIPPR